MTKIALRAAAQNAKAYLNDLDGFLGNNFKNLLIEETELSEDEKYWLITIGFDREVEKRKNIIPNNPLMSPEVVEVISGRKQFAIERVYKVFKVDSSTGEVVSMKMYQL